MILSDQIKSNLDMIKSSFRTWLDKPNVEDLVDLAVVGGDVEDQLKMG